MGDGKWPLATALLLLGAVGLAAADVAPKTAPARRHSRPSSRRSCSIWAKSDHCAFASMCASGANPSIEPGRNSSAGSSTTPT